MHPSDDPPEIRMLHVTTDEAGQTLTHRCLGPALSLRRAIGDSPPMWVSEPVQDTLSRTIWVLPPGWRGGWHTNPQRQLVVVLSGRWWVETQDAIRTVMGPGEAHLGDDLESTPDSDGHVGHDSAVEGDEAAVLLMIPVGGGRTECHGVVGPRGSAMA